MKYIVFDMEWNQTMGPGRTLADGRRLTGEIIEIGAVRLSEAFAVEATFKAVVKPVFYKKMHKKVQELTGIDADTLKGGMSFPEAYELFLAFCTDDFATVTWGDGDVPILKENISAHNLGKWNAKNYNLQRIYDKEVAKTSQNTALDTAVEALGISIEAPYHDALNDALATAGICKKIDMAVFLKRYVSPVVSLSALDHVGFEEIHGITDVQAMKAHPRIRYTMCPHCKSPLQTGKLVSYGSGRRLAKITCPEHGDFVVLIRLSKGKNNTHVASKYIYTWDKDTSALYAERSAIAERKKEAFLSKIRQDKEKKKETKNNE